VDLSPSGIRKVQFREKLRGYHPEDVDAFVAEVANRVQALEQQVEALTARASDAETRASESTGSEEQLRRTLVLAQRTADLAVQEAREEATRLIAEAQAHRDSLLAEATEAQQRATEDARRTATDELARYAEAREHLAADVRALDEYLREQRTRIAAALADAREAVEQGAYLSQPPELHDVQVPAPAEIAPPPVPVPEPVESTDDIDDIAPTPGSVDDDPFLAELRRAVTDTEPLGPRETGASSGLEHPDLFADDGDEGRSRLPWRR
jgi:DivIVA domain-containing protein